MSVPAFTDFGDLPEGVYQLSWAEAIAVFGTGSTQRVTVTNRLERIWTLAINSGGLDRLIIFGSYVTTKAEPRDVDVVLVMQDDFALADCPESSRVLFDHARADEELGASVFWIRPSMLLKESLEQFIAGWQLTRDHRRRGIVEIKP